MLTLVLNMACVPTGTSLDSRGDADSGTPAGDTAPDSGADTGLVADIDNVSVTALADGAVRLAFHTATPCVAQAFYDNGEGRPRSSAPEAADTNVHQLALVGVAPGATFTWRVELTAAGVSLGAATGEGTGATLSGAPTFTQTDFGGVAADGLILVSAVKEMHPWVLLVDEAGRTVWAVDLGAGESSVTAPRFAHDGRSVLINSQAPSADARARIGRVDFDGTISAVAEAPGLHIDYAERPDGRIVGLGWELRSFGDRTLLGDTLVLVDGEASTVLWSAFDALPVDLGQTYEKGFYVPDPNVEDWSHVNGVSLDPETGDILATMALDDGVMRVDGETGATEWWLTSTADSTLDTAGQRLTDLPHWVQSLGEGHVLVFNRGDRRVDPDACSTVADVAVDPDAGSATASWTYTSPDCRQTPFRGAAVRLTNGNTLVDYSAGGQLEEVDAAGERVRALQAGAGWELGFVDHSAALR